MSSHTTKTTSFRRCALAEPDAHRDFLLKTGLKRDFDPVEPDQSVAKSNWRYAVSSDRPILCYGNYWCRVSIWLAWVHRQQLPWLFEGGYGFDIPLLDQRDE
jgi:hypothetical protein